MEADGIHLLYNTCLDTIDCRELEAVIYLASVIMRKCFPKSRLPLSTLRNPLTFPIPQSDIYGSLSSELTEGIVSVGCIEKKFCIFINVLNCCHCMTAKIMLCRVNCTCAVGRSTQLNLDSLHSLNIN